MNNCIICFEKYHPTDDDIIQMKCNHHIHENCYNDLVECFSTCPLCKKKIISDF